MTIKSPFNLPHHPRKSWEARIAERLPWLDKVRAWRDAAIADGWTIRPTYISESVETAFTMERQGYKVLGLGRPAGTMLPQAEIHVWGPDGLAIIPPEIYDWAAIQLGAETCQYCGVHSTKTERVGFAGRACLICFPIEQAKLPRNWAD